MFQKETKHQRGDTSSTGPQAQNRTAPVRCLFFRVIRVLRVIRDSDNTRVAPLGLSVWEIRWGYEHAAPLGLPFFTYHVFPGGDDGFGTTRGRGNLAPTKRGRVEGFSDTKRTIDTTDTS